MKLTKKKLVSIKICTGFLKILSPLCKRNDCLTGHEADTESWPVNIEYRKECFLHRKKCSFTHKKLGLDDFWHYFVANLQPKIFATLNFRIPYGRYYT